MSVNIGNNNKISKSNISEQHNVDKSENHTNTTIKKFYQKEGFWSGLITGVVSSLIASAIIWGITELIKIF